VKESKESKENKENGAHELRNSRVRVIQNSPYSQWENVLYLRILRRDFNPRFVGLTLLLYFLHGNNTYCSVCSSGHLRSVLVSARSKT
jgi:hypothetical protein